MKCITSENQDRNQRRCPSIHTHSISDIIPSHSTAILLTLRLFKQRQWRWKKRLQATMQKSSLTTVEIRFSQFLFSFECVGAKVFYVCLNIFY